MPTVVNADGKTQFEGVYGEVNADGAYEQQGKVGAVLDCHDSVVFHANNADYTGNDAFRTCCHAEDKPPVDDGSFTLNTDGSIDTFYDIPTFDYTTHNNYIFKGWYMHPVQEDQPFSWDMRFEGSADVYAHWIAVNDVEKEETDAKESAGDSYHEYELMGVQIRDKDNDQIHHYGERLAFYHRTQRACV